MDRKYNNLKNRGEEEAAEKLVNGIVDYWPKKILEKTGVKLEVKGAENVPRGSLLLCSKSSRIF